MIRTSVIIPVYNTIEYLDECVRSVLAQAVDETEIILVDDGSTDGSLQLCEEYAAGYDNVKLIRQEHRFQGTARNRGLEKAIGEYVYFMDSDDIIKPGLFDRCYDVCRENDLDFVMFDAEGFIYDENDTELAVPDDICDRSGLGIRSGIYTGPEFWNEQYNSHGLLYVVWLLYIKRSFLLENDLFFEERTYFEDNDWMLRTYLSAGRTMYLPEKMHRHRWRRGSNMLDGFTVDLMKGCFRMHDVLIKISEGVDSNEKRRMAEDVILLNIRRFERLKEIGRDREDAYSGPLKDFCSKLLGYIADPERSTYAKSIDTAALDRVIRSTKEWENAPEISIKAEDLPVWMPGPACPDGSGSQRIIVIYGTGNVGKRYYGLLEEFCEMDRLEIVFAETMPEEGAACCGRPVLPIKEAARMRPDDVIIASTKYAEEMWRTAKEDIGEESVLIMMPKEMKFFL